MKTYYELDYEIVENTPYNIPLAIKDLLEEITTNPSIVHISTYGLEFDWENRDGDMEQLSKKIPTVLFTVYGTNNNGEFIVYYKGGESQYTEGVMVFEDCNLI